MTFLEMPLRPDRAVRLDGAGIEIADLTLRKPTLDDVFLALTGHHAESIEAQEREPAQIGGAR